MKNTDRIESVHLGREVNVWWTEPSRGAALTAFLDGEFYLERMGALETLATTGRLAGCVFVSYVDAAARHRDFTCNQAYTRFLVDELPRWADAIMGTRLEGNALVGLSLSGLAAAHAAFTRPAVYPRLVTQSASFWWEDEWLRTQLEGGTFLELPERVWVSVGDAETETGVEHDPTPLVQAVSQVDACRRMAEALEARGVATRYRVFDGGHDPACWAAELSEALSWGDGA